MTVYCSGGVGGEGRRSGNHPAAGRGSDITDHAPQRGHATGCHDGLDLQLHPQYMLPGWYAVASLAIGIQPL